MYDCVSRKQIIDYINKQIEDVEVEVLQGFTRMTCAQSALKDTLEYIKSLPATDVVDVVRCKDCCFCKYDSNADIF